ncbi:MAG: hypothetical protein QWI73_03725 [Alphaproteobacteria bacterium]|nr:hypothetical protein [Alphaproteobacteria bacterium]
MPFFLLLNHVTHIRLTNSKARNPLAGNEHLVERANRVLRNTTEQLIFSFINVTVDQEPKTYSIAQNNFSNESGQSQNSSGLLAKS